MEKIVSSRSPRARAEDLALFVESATDRAVFVTDAEGLVTSWLKGAETLLGWTPAEVLGRSAAFVYPVNDTLAGQPGLDRATAAEAGPQRIEAWPLK